MSENEPFIKLINVSKEFDGKAVLKNVSVEINEGESLGLLGRSGAGKSVLLHMLRGTAEYAPTSGEVIFRVAICPHYLDIADSLGGDIVAHDFAVDVLLAHTSSDQLGVLRTKIENQNPLGGSASWGSGWRLSRHSHRHPPGDGKLSIVSGDGGWGLGAVE